MSPARHPPDDQLDAATWCRHLVPDRSVYAFLADHRHQLFPPEALVDLTRQGRGHPSVPAEVLASVMVLQALEGLSDGRRSVRCGGTSPGRSPAGCGWTTRGSIPRCWCTGATGSAARSGRGGSSRWSARWRRPRCWRGGAGGCWTPRSWRMRSRPRTRSRSWSRRSVGSAGCSPQARAVKLGAHDGAVAFATTAFEQRDCRHENAPTSPCSCPTLHLQRLPLPPDVIVIAVRWYLRFGLSYRDVEELLAERGVEVDHVTVYRWVQRFTPLLAEAARPCRHAVGDRWWVDETYVKVAGRWRCLYRAIDQFGQVIDVVVSPDVTRKQPTSSSSGQSVRPESGRLRSSPTEHRPIRWSSMAYCQRPGTAPTGTPTTPSRPITAG